MGEHSFTEADVLGWEVRDKEGWVVARIRPTALEDGEVIPVSEMRDILDGELPDQAPHRVCAVVPWPQEDADDSYIDRMVEAQHTPHPDDDGQGINSIYEEDLEGDPAGVAAMFDRLSKLRPQEEDE